LLRAIYGLTLVFFSHFNSKAQAGAALNFDGSNDYVNFPSSSWWNLGNNFTLEMWIKPNSIGNQILFYGGYGCVVCPQWELSIGAEQTCGYGGTAGRINFTTIMGARVESGASPSIGVWTHVAITYNGDILKMYINGILQVSTPQMYTRVRGTIGNPSYMSLGEDPGCGGRYPYNGSIDEFRVWNTVRTQCEIQSYMNCEIATTATNLLANFHCNAGIGGANNSGLTSLIDASGTSGNGVLTNFGLVGATSNWVTPGAVNTGSFTPAAPLVEINITGNGSTITNGDVTPSTADHTDFNGATTRTFVIQNTIAGGTLNAGVYFTGINAPDFSVTTLPATAVSGIGSTSFVVTLMTGGVKTATVNINNNDCDEPIYTFAITASASTASELNFDGVDDGIQIAYTTPYNFTIEYWMRTSQTGGTGTQWWNGAGIVDAETPGIANDFGTSLTGSKLAFGTGGDVTIFSNSDVNTGQWVHVAATRNQPTGEMKLYINGVLEASTLASTAGLYSPWAIAIGRMLTSASYYNGDLDEVRIWNNVRTQCEVQSYMNCEISSTTFTNLVANFHFNQGVAASNNSTVTTLIDVSGNYNNGTLANMALTGSTSNWINAGAVVTDYSSPSSSLAVINVQGNATTITNNDLSPSAADFTDFQSNSTRTFVIQNTGTGLLTLNTLTLTGPNSSEFSVVSLPSNTLGTGASGTVVIAFTPTATGVRNATVNILSTDCSTPLYMFAVEGTAPAAEALSFDGTDDVVSGPLLTTNTTSLTLQAKVYWYGTSSSAQMIIYNGHSSVRGCGIYNSLGNGALHILYGGVSFTPFNYTLTPNVWTSITAVVKNGIVECYVNGLLVNVTNVSNPNTPNSGLGDLFTIGSNAVGGENFNGRIDEVRFWDRALTQCEIQTFLNCEIPGTATNLLGNYHFNQGSPGLSNLPVTTLTDASGNSNHLSLSNFALTGTVSNWVSPGAVVSGFSTTSAPSSSITLTGNGNPVANGSTTVTTLNFTDFGSATTSTFVIQNSNTGTLTIGTPYLTGINASEFSITVLPSPTLAASATTTLMVAFTPTSGGARNATVNINSNDCSISVFSFAVQGTAPLASALDFDGSDDYIALPMNASIPVGNSPYTIEAKVRPGAFGSFGIIGWGDFVNTNQTNALRLGTGGVVYNYWFNNDLMISAPTLTNGAWHHIAATYDGTARRIYIDGILYGEDFPTGHNVLNTANLKVGSTCPPCGGEYFYGGMDEVRVWNIARTECELQSFKDCEIPNTSPGLVLNYHFNQGSGGLDNSGVITAADVSASAITGTLTNFGLSGLTSNWISPGSVANGYSIATVPSASISVSGNGNPIANTSTTATTLNHTDFGSASTRTFVIQNSNTGTLNIGSPFFTGINASEFSVTVLPSSTTLAALATTSFVVAFTPTASGARSATVNISSNDCNEPIFNFKIEGTPPPAEGINFDGVDDYIDLVSTNNLPNGNNDFTVEFWIKPKSAQAGHRWVAWMGAVISGSMVTFGYDGNNGNKIRVHHLGPDLMANTATVTLNVWTHVAINYRGATNSNDIFINGNYIETLNFGVPLALPLNTPLQIGTFNSLTTYAAHAELDEFRIWDRALCASEIQNNMNCEISTTAPGLVLNYHFNQGSANVSNAAVPTATDASGSVNTGTLINLALTGVASNWISPGAVTTGSSCSAYFDPEINLMGNGVTITDGDITPSVTDNTDFGAICINTAAVNTFSIQNLGTGPLSISSITMSGSGAASFTIGSLSPASPIAAGSSATFAVTFTPSASGIQNATITVLSNDCSEALYDVVLSGTCNTLPVVSAAATNSVVCNTFTTILNGGGADTYTWSPPVTDGVPFSPPTTTTYTVSGTNTLTGCTSTNAATQVITVNALPVVTVTSLSNSVCSGGSVTITGSGADTYTWNPGSLNGATITPSPAITTTYSAFGTNTLTGCTSTNTAAQTITVYAIPLVTAAAPSQTICLGGTATLTASGASAYTWNPGPISGATVNTSPAANTTYTLTGTSTAGCTNTNLSTITISVIALPTVVINPVSVVICAGASASLSASGASTYTWNPGILIGGSITPSPTSNTGYTVVGTSTAGCTSTNIAVQIVTVNALPSVTASTTNSVICNSGTTSLLGSGADTYTWTGNITNGTPFSPTITTSYTLSGTYTLTGCTNTNLAVQTISVNPSPTVNIAVINPTICAGNAPTLTASGANSYTWLPGSLTNTVITPTLAATTIFTLTGTSPAGCYGTSVFQTITVNPLPVVTASASSPSVCAGNTISLFGGGASSYVWTGGVTNNTAFTPASTTAYTVTGTDANNCQNTVAITVTVNVIPTVSANITSTAVCQGNALTLSGSGATTYTWSGGIIDGQAFIPASSGNYSLTGTNLAGCSSTNLAVTSVTVNALPFVTANVGNSTICAGNTTTLSGSGALTYSWTGGVIDNTSFSPTVTATYTVTGQDVNGCQDTASALITVNDLPMLTILGTNTVSCEAESTTLTVNGADIYTWSNTQNTAVIIVTPTVTTTYSVIGSYTNGCSNSASYTQSISPCNGTLTAIASVTNISCTNKGDGQVSILVTNSYSTSIVEYIWSPETLCVPNNCNHLESLNGGTISVTVRVTYTLNNILIKQDSIVISPIIVLDEQGPCNLKIFNGFSPNNDGINDTWQIENITEFPKNKVMVYNRWGVKVFETEGYNNTTKSWPGGDEAAKLGSNTYFYVIDPGDGSKPIKGWVELIKN